MTRLVLTLLAIAALAVSSLAASARSDGGAVFVNETRVLTLRGTIGRSGPAERATQLAARLAKMPQINLSVKNERNAARILSGNELLILINADEAKRAGMSPAALASTWVKNLRDAWDLPAVRFAQGSITLPPGGDAVVPMVGSQVRTAPLTSTEPAIAQAARRGPDLTLKGLQVGTTLVTIGSATLTVNVRPYAATLPQSINVRVVGNPATGATIKGAVEGAIRARLEAVPGAQWTWNAFETEQMQPGERRMVPVRVKATAPEAFPSEGLVNIVVSNLPVGHKREVELWYCNEPEDVKRPQALFRANLDREQPVRMLYHHINTMPSALFVRVMAINDSDETANVVIIPGDSKDKNPVLAGVLAADPFYRNWLLGSGEVISLPPRTSFPIAFRRLAPQETISGLCYLRLLDGPSQVTVVTEALTPYELDSRWQAALITPTPWRQVGVVQQPISVHRAEDSDLIFPNPFKQYEFTHTVGGNFSFFRIGQRPIDRRTPGKPLDGNFGVIYNIVAKAENPTLAAAELELVFETSAGYSGGIFTVDGQFVRLPLMQPKAEARLARFRLEPGRSRTINVSTIPLSGSSYPATLVLRPVSSMPDLPLPDNR
jgi:hypothetical protein